MENCKHMCEKCERIFKNEKEPNYGLCEHKCIKCKKELDEKIFCSYSYNDIIEDKENKEEAERKMNEYFDKILIRKEFIDMLKSGLIKMFKRMV